MEPQTHSKTKHWLAILCVVLGFGYIGFLLGRGTAPDWVSAERDRAFFDKGWTAAQLQGKTTTTTDAWELIDRLRICLVQPKYSEPSPWPSDDEMRMIAKRLCFPQVLREHIKSFDESK